MQLRNEHVEREVLQSQKENKQIIPCFYSHITDETVKWNLNSYQGIEFDDKYDLALKLYRNINKDETLAKKRETFHNHLNRYNSNQRKKTPKEQHNEVRDIRSDAGKGENESNKIARSRKRFYQISNIKEV